MGVRVVVLSVGVLLAACGAPAESASVEVSDAEAACVDFYRSAAESTEEEAVYMRALAERIAEGGHREAAAVLSDIADQWEVGTWEGDEMTQLAQWAEAGQILGSEGELRCTDLAEWWGIDGYQGQPDPLEILARQRQIWRENGLDNYYLLVAGKTAVDERFTQVQIRVVDGEVEELKEVESTSLDTSDLPHTVDDYYDLISDLDAQASFYDLVYAYPRRASTPDETEYLIRLDPNSYPETLIYFDTPEDGGELEG